MADSEAAPLGDKDNEEDDDLQHHITAALAHVPGDTAVVPAVVLHHVDLLQQVIVVLHMQRKAIAPALVICACIVTDVSGASLVPSELNRL